MLCSMPFWTHWQKYCALVIAHSTWLGGTLETWQHTGVFGTDPCTSSSSDTCIFQLSSVECHPPSVNCWSFWSLPCCMKCWSVFPLTPSLGSHFGACWVKFLLLQSHMASRNGEARAPRLVIPSFGECCIYDLFVVKVTHNALFVGSCSVWLDSPPLLFYTTTNGRPPTSLTLTETRFKAPPSYLLYIGKTKIPFLPFPK